MHYPHANDNWDPHHLGSYDWEPFFEESPIPNGPSWTGAKGSNVNSNVSGKFVNNAKSAAFDSINMNGKGSPGGFGKVDPDWAYGGPYGYSPVPYGYPPYPPVPAGYGGYSGGGNGFWIVIILLILLGGGYYLYKKGYFE